MAAHPVSSAPTPVPPSSGIPFRINTITGIAAQHMPCHEESIPTVMVLPLTTLADKTALEKILVETKRLADESKIDQARTCISEYKKSLKDPLDPQKLIWRAFCTIQLSFLELMDLTKIPQEELNDPRHRLIHILDVSPNQKKIDKSRAFLAEALQDLEAAQLSTASDAIITQNDLRNELYQDLLFCYAEFSKNSLSHFYAGKIRELKAFYKKQLPEQSKVHTPVSQNTITVGYSAITKLFIFAVVLITAVGAATLYQHYRIRRL